MQEGEDAQLTCHATGNPIPRVTWKREDGEAILLRKPGSREIVKGKEKINYLYYFVVYEE